MESIIRTDDSGEGGPFDNFEALFGAAVLNLSRMFVMWAESTSCGAIMSFVSESQEQSASADSSAGQELPAKTTLELPFHDINSVMTFDAGSSAK